MNRVYRYILILLLCTASSLTYAQEEVEFKAELSKEKLGLNERLRIDFTINQRGSDQFRPPEFKSFRKLAGPMQSMSQSFINGKQSFNRSYGYILEPKAKGTFTIGSAQIEIDGKVYRTAQKTVTVVESVDKSDSTPSYMEDDVMDQIHLVAEVSKTNPYLNEGLSVTYKLYIAPDVNISNPRVIDMPKFNNFWSQVVDIDQLRLQEGQYRGQPYEYVTLRRAVLYPQATGKLKIEPFTISLDVKIPTNRRNMFGQPIYETKRKNLASATRTIDVKDLPSEGKPATFTGAVGDFDFGVSTTKNELKTSESLEAKVTISGRGNLKLLNIPKLPAPSSLEVYDPEHNESVQTSISGMRGSVSDNYTIVPGYPGSYTIPAMSFSYFDPNSEKYKTLRSNPEKITVNNGPQGTTVANAPTASSANGSDSLYAETATQKKMVKSSAQFRFVKLNADLHPFDQSSFFKSRRFWILLLIPLVAIPIGFFIKRRQGREVNLSDKRSKKAGKLAKKYLSDAKKNLGEQQKFYIALERSLYNYVKAKFSISTGEMSKDRTAELLTEHGVDQEHTVQFNELLESCEFARYTPTSDVKMKADYEKAARVIAQIDKQLK